MSSEAVGRYMPSVVTLDDLTAMMAADEHHRYEIGPEGVLSLLFDYAAAHGGATISVPCHRYPKPV